MGWLPLLSALETRFHVVAPDLPGCGLTDKVNFRGVSVRQYIVDFLESLMDSLGVARAAFVGNSLGGYSILAFARTLPQRVTKLALVGAPLGIEKSVPHFIRLLGIRGINSLLCRALLKPDLVSTRELFRYTLVSNVARVPQDYLHCSYLSRLIPGSDVAWLTMLEELTTFRGFREKYLIREELHRIQQPTLFLWGERDWFLPPWVGEQACKLMHNARLEVLEDAGHLLWLDQPKITEELVVQFLGQETR